MEDDLTLPIPYEKTLFFYYDLPYGSAPDGATECRQSIKEATGIIETDWEAMTRDEQDFAIAESFKEWFSRQIDSGWDIE